MDKLIICETDRGRYAVRPMNWVGIWNEKGQIQESLNHSALFIEEEDAKKFIEWKEAEEQGKLLKLPCAVGDRIYVSDRDGMPREMILDPPDIRCHCAKEDNLCMVLCDRKNTGICAYRFKNDGSDIGKRAFLTREEAEAALKEL